MRYLFIIPALLLLTAPAYGERYEYRSDVNQLIPDSDSTGLTDTIFVPVHVMIEEINFFVGIGVFHEPWAENVWVDVYSPAGGRVRLNGWDVPRRHWYYVWYDTEREVDGPGHLDDYVGLDSYGSWSMNAFDMFDDRELTWFYWIIEIYGEPMTGLEDRDLSGIPEDFELLGNYPNPFNSSTAIQFGLPEQAEVKIEIYDVLGRLVRVLTKETLPAGYHRVVWAGHDEEKSSVSSGVYLLRMKTGDRSFDKRMTLIK